MNCEDMSLATLGSRELPIVGSIQAEPSGLSWEQLGARSTGTEGPWFSYSLVATGAHWKGAS